MGLTIPGFRWIMDIYTVIKEKVHHPEGNKEFHSIDLLIFKEIL